MKKFIMLVGPPGSGKSTLAEKYVAEGFERFNQDDQGKGHLHSFDMAVFDGKNVLVDRMNFDVKQRSRYLDIAKSKDYHTTIIVLHESYATCVERAAKRVNHPTIKDDATARKAVNFFFSHYERVQDSEADDVIRIWPGGDKEAVIVCDLDGTLCDVEHRRHHVRPPEGYGVLGHLEVADLVTGEGMPKPFKKNWAGFFRDIPKDTINEWCLDIIENFASTGIDTVFCTGRSENEKKPTVEWLAKHGLGRFPLYMRNRQDSRQDNIIKEIILDFELLTRYRPYFMIDDRDQVVQMWRKRGFICLQCAPGDF